jgi:hypothetical protein
MGVFSLRYPILLDPQGSYDSCMPRGIARMHDQSSTCPASCSLPPFRNSAEPIVRVIADRNPELERAEFSDKLHQHEAEKGEGKEA